jgi:hypothetical protein
MAVILGLAQPLEDAAVDFTVSKLGGMPNFAKKPLKRCQVECIICNGMCVFVAQVYAPEDENPGAYHKSVYLFSCLKCNSHRSYRIGYAETECLEKEDVLCAVCGLKAEFRCSSCSDRNFCSKEHQIFDWMEHRKRCRSGAFNLDASLEPAKFFRLLPSFEISSLEVSNEKADEIEDEAEIEDESSMGGAVKMPLMLQGRPVSLSDIHRRCCATCALLTLKQKPSHCCQMPRQWSLSHSHPTTAATDAALLWSLKCS